MFKGIIRLIYLYSQPMIPHHQTFTPTWEVVTEVSLIFSIKRPGVLTYYLPYVRSYDGTPNHIIFVSENNYEK